MTDTVLSAAAHSPAEDAHDYAVSPSGGHTSPRAAHPAPADDTYASAGSPRYPSSAHNKHSAPTVSADTGSVSQKSPRLRHGSAHLPASPSPSPDGTDNSCHPPPSAPSKAKAADPEISAPAAQTSAF